MIKREDGSKDVWMHFSGAFFVAFGLFCVCVVYLYISLGGIDDQDRLAYHRLSHSLDGSETERAFTSRQQRRGLQKDILFFDKGQHLQMSLRSDLAELALDHHDGKVDIVENMSGVTCYIQEELLYRLPDGGEATKQEDGRLLIKHANREDLSSWVSLDTPGVEAVQIVRFLEADTAFYYYKNDKLVAEKVKISRYMAPGHSIDEASTEITPIMRGVAAWVEFNLKGKEANFKAYQLKAKFYSPSRGL